MGATITSASKTSEASAFINRLSLDYPQFIFKAGAREHWSPRAKTITYNPSQEGRYLRYGLLHELAHALLGHNIYNSDFELLRMEGEAWSLASKIGKKYHVIMDQEHIQNCLDTYRDWLHRRSTCPACGTHAMQVDVASYHCFNCQTKWQVSSGRFVRPYRKVINNPKTA